MSTEKPRDVQTSAIAADTIALRSRSWNRLRFEIEYALERGTTANSYVIRGDRVALIDPPGQSFTEPFLAALAQVVNPAAIAYVIVGHTNPNRMETLKALLAVNPALTVICSNPASRSLKSAFTETPLDLRVVKGSGET
ncbi:MAG: flavin oxidoreductase, partial [Cyanobacteria bacterium P01_C01_bin.73]